MAQNETGIITPADLAGMRIAVKNDTWRRMIGKLLEQFDLTFADVVEVPSGFDMQPFYDGEVDVWAGFIQDEAVRARIAGLDIVTLPLHEYGFRTVALSIPFSQSSNSFPIALNTTGSTCARLFFSNGSSSRLYSSCDPSRELRMSFQRSVLIDFCAPITESKNSIP